MSAAAAAASQYVEEPCFYVYQVALTANQALRDQAVPVDRDADFMLTGIHGTSTSTYTINFRLPSGRQFANTQLHNVNLVGTAAEPALVGPAPVYAAGSVGPALDITDTSGAGNTVEIIFSGIRRLKGR
jgi:hypothetical protein